MRTQEREIKYFSQKELKKIFSAIEKTKDSWNRFWLRDLCIFQLWYFCGLRASEVWLIKISDYNPRNSEIYIRRLKGSLNTTIRLDSKRKSILDKYIREYQLKNSDKPLFISRNFKAVSGITITYLTDKYIKSIPSISDEKRHFHTLKHTIAVHLAESWVDIKELREYLGHKRIESTLQYFSYTTAQKNAFYEKIAKGNMIVS